MKIIHINTNDNIGGAAIAARRIVESQRYNEYNAYLYVLNQSLNLNYIESDYGPIQSLYSKLLFKVDQLFIYKYKKKERILFTPGILSQSAFNDNLLDSTNIVNLHWLSQGFSSIQSFSKLKGRTIFWTMHDSWAFTGGCHISFDCQRYRNACGKCKILHSEKQKDISYQTLKCKLRKFSDINFITISPSQWMKNRIEESALFKEGHNVHIPNPINREAFKPIDSKVFLRKALNLNSDKILLGFTSINASAAAYKGFYLLQEAIIILVGKYPELKNKIQLVVFGSYYSKDWQDLPLDVKFIGNVQNENLLPFIYNALDIFLTPSLEDNYPNTVLESLACGIPVVAFKTGGIPEMVISGTNGMLAAEYNNSASYADAILSCIDSLKVLNADDIAKTTSRNSFYEVGKKYLELYETF